MRGGPVKRFCPADRRPPALLLVAGPIAHRRRSMLTLSEAEIAEAGEMIAGRKRVPETATTIFKSVGMGLEDIAAAKLVYGLAKARRERA
jgi:ornithine cyclodeaminase/alanine dehydrogenase-like protein (mu-crystallin family)